MAKKIDPNKTFVEMLEHSFQVFFDLFFAKNKFVVWIFSVFLCLFLLICGLRMFRRVSCSKKR